MPDAPAPRTPRDAGRPWWHLSRTGLFFGAAYFLTSMAPSLLPRTRYYQGLISGLCAAIGPSFYGTLFELSGGYSVPMGLAALLNTGAAVIILRGRRGLN